MDTIKNTVDALTGMPNHPAPPSDQYIRWNAPGVEVIKDNEDETAAKIGDVMNQMQKLNFDKHQHTFRGTHIKTQGIVKGKLEVLPHLPMHLRQGMFSEPGKVYDVAARYANEPIWIQADLEPGPKGFSMKVFGVSGKRLEGVPDDLTTQDWMFNNAPSIELTDMETALDIMSMRLEHFDSPAGLSVAMKLRKDAIKQHAPFMLPNTNVISHDFYTQSAFRFGDYYGHLGLFPVEDEQKEHNEKVQSKNKNPISDWLQDYFGGAAAKYELRIQLGTDPAHHPTEDASVVWDEKTAPYQTIATLTFPKQNSFSHQRRVYWDDEMSLSPWRGLEAHRPLGSINRLRKIVYQRSKGMRDTMNSRKSHDVDSIDQIPD